MKFDKHLPTERLRPYIRCFAVSEGEASLEYKVFPSPGLVMGFQYKGRLAAIGNGIAQPLAPSGISGISAGCKIYRNAAGTGTLLVYFTETGLAHFTATPANELFDLSVSLDNIFPRSSIGRTEAELSAAVTDRQRIGIVERLLLAQLRDIEADRQVAEAVRLIGQSGGLIKIKALSQRLFLSQSPLEKRFRRIVGTTPKKFASIIRFQSVLRHLGGKGPLTEIGYDHHFFDQAHFIRSFRQFTGDTPERFRRHL